MESKPSTSSYERPALTVLGTVAELTKGNVAPGSDKDKMGGLS